MGKIAVAAQGTIRFIQLSDWQEVAADRIEITKSCGKITKLFWTKDGSILTVTTSNGYFIGFLTVIPSLFSSFETHVALLSSLTEVSVIDCGKNNQIIVKVGLDIEPTFLRMGPIHFCVGINSAISYYKWRSSKAKVVCKRDYFTSIKAVCMNDVWTAVLSTTGTVSLHMIEDA